MQIRKEYKNLCIFLIILLSGFLIPCIIALLVGFFSNSLEMIISDVLNSNEWWPIFIFTEPPYFILAIFWIVWSKKYHRQGVIVAYILTLMNNILFHGAYWRDLFSECPSSAGALVFPFFLFYEIFIIPVGYGLGWLLGWLITKWSKKSYEVRKYERK